MKSICFVTTIPTTLRAFILQFAKYMHENCDCKITFISSPNEEFQSSLPEYIRYIPVKMERGVSLGGFKSFLTLYKIFKKEKFDLVQYSTPNAACYASVAAFLTRIPVRLYCQWGIAYVGLEGVKRKIFKNIERLVCFCSTKVEPDSNSNLLFSIKEKLYKASKGEVIWNGSASGVNLEKFDISKKNEYRNEIRSKLDIPDNAFVYGFVGRINRDKGINELFTAMRSVMSSNEQVYLILVGNPELSKGVDASLYAWAKNEKRVIFCGYTNVVEQYVASMDCYVLPSYREGFGLAVVEAEAMGVPVVVTNIPGPIDAMESGKSGIVVEKMDSTGLENALLVMLAQQNLCDEFGKFGVELAKERFEQKKLFEKILADRKNLLKIQ